jgi:hypothetical protein
VQIAALLYHHEEELEPELIRVANEMRENHEPIPGDDGVSDAPRFWNVYQDRLVHRADAGAFLEAVPPADHLATFVWLFPENSIATDRRALYAYMRAALEERAGERDRALSTYTRLRDQFAKDGSLRSGGSLVDRTLAGIKRLSKTP